MSGLLSADKSLLVMVDVQERILPAMDNPRNVIENTQKLLLAAARLDIPVFVSEHYAKGLGQTAVSLSSYVQGSQARLFEKMDFSCYRDSAIRDAVKLSGRQQIILSGIEAHVCVLQTAIEFKNAGYDVFVCADAVSSRKASNVELAFQRLQFANIPLVSLEMVLFEWLGSAKHAQFKDIMSLVK